MYSHGPVVAGEAQLTLLGVSRYFGDISGGRGNRHSRYNKAYYFGENGGKRHNQ